MNAVRRLPHVLLALAATSPAPGGEAEGFVPLFNGRDLTGWVRTNTAPSTWTVRDGMLICSGKPIGELRTERMYQNFVMEIEWRHMVPGGNAGIFVWSDDIPARGVPFHRAVEVQVLENDYGNGRGHTTHGDVFPIHGATMTPINGRGGQRAFPTEHRSKPSPEWNHYRIECRDGAISLAVNGKVVTRGEDASPRKGYICLESEGGVVHYRNARIKVLPDTPVEPAQIATANRGFRTLYSGLDLDGWTTKAEEGHWTSKDWVLAYDGKAGGDPALATTSPFGNMGFVFDVRLKESSGVPRVFLRGTEGVEIAVDHDGPLGELLQKPGRWNRFEGTFVGDTLVLSVNGEEVGRTKSKAGPRSGPIVIVPEGPVDFANLFVRDVKDAE